MAKQLVGKMENILHTIERNSEGYLLNLADWNADVANAIANEDGLALSAEHWKIINLIREFYANFNASPTVRVLLNILRAQDNNTNIDSLYLLKLFPAGPAKQANKIAGLPKPVQCI